MFQSMKKFGTLAQSLSLLALAVASIALTSSADVVAENPDDAGPAPCPHIGVQWQDPRVSFEAPVICDGSLKVKIGVNGGGAEISYSSSGCPAHIIVIPGHFKQVQKLHHKVGNCQPLNYIKLDFKCVGCGFLWMWWCCESAGVGNTPNTVTSCEEFPCEIATSYGG